MGSLEDGERSGIDLTLYAVSSGQVSPAQRFLSWSSPQRNPRPREPHDSSRVWQPRNLKMHQVCSHRYPSVPARPSQASGVLLLLLRGLQIKNQKFKAYLEHDEFKYAVGGPGCSPASAHLVCMSSGVPSPTPHKSGRVYILRAPAPSTWKAGRPGAQHHPQIHVENSLS